MSVFVLVLIILVISVALIIKKSTDAQDQKKNKVLNAFKVTADKFLVDIEHCDVRNTSYVDRGQDTVGDKVLNLVSAAGPGAAGMPGVEDDVIQSSFTYYFRDKVFPSGNYQMPITTLKERLKEGKVYLYLSKADGGHYVFEVNK
jgi:hypothetical protein